MGAVHAVMLALGVQLIQRLSLIPGWAGFAAPKPELGVEHMRGPTGPLFFCARDASIGWISGNVLGNGIACATWLCCNTLGFRLPSQIWNPARHSSFWSAHSF